MSILDSYSRNYRPTPDPYRGSGFYERTPGQEILEMRGKNKARVRDIYEQSQLKKERDRANFLATIAGPQNLFTAPRDAREATVQRLVNEDIMGRRAGVEMAPKWDDFRRKQINAELQTLANLEAYRNLPRQRQMESAKLMNDIRDRRIGSSLALAKNAREERDAALKEEGFEIDLENDEFNQALQMIESGVPPEQVGRMFPYLPMSARQQLAAYARSPLIQAGIETATGRSSNPQAQALAEDYNRRERAAKKHQENIAAMRQTNIPSGFWSKVGDAWWNDEVGGRPDSEAIANYTTRFPVEDTMDVYKADPTARKLIRRGANGWEPIMGEVAAPTVNDLLRQRQSSVLQQGGGQVGLGANAGQPPVIRTPEEYAMLPSGEVFINPYGRRMRKP